MKARRRRARRKGGGWWRGEKGWGCGFGTRSLGSHSSHAVPSLPSLAALASTVAILGSPSMRHPHNSPRLLIAHPLSPSVFHRLQSHQNRPLLRVSHDYTVPDTTRRDEEMCDVGFLALGTAHGPLTHARALTGVRELTARARAYCIPIGLDASAWERPTSGRRPEECPIWGVHHPLTQTPRIIASTSLPNRIPVLPTRLALSLAQPPPLRTDFPHFPSPAVTLPSPPLDLI